jgi:hypothetical protein
MRRGTTAFADLRRVGLGSVGARLGGRVVGREAVPEYWARQFEAISSRERLTDSSVIHPYRLEGGLITRMDVEEPAGDGD